MFRLDKKSMIIIVGALFVAFFVLQAKVIVIENGSKTMVYTPPFNSYETGGSANADLLAALEEKYGVDGVETKMGKTTWEGNKAVVYDTTTYDFEYLGKALKGGHYIRCSVLTKRTVKSADTMKILYQTERTYQYLGFDDGLLDSEVRAQILWGTEAVAYAEDEASFNQIIGE